MKQSCNVAPLIERYFTGRLMRQRNVIANTIASYRVTFRLLFKFAQVRLRMPPSALAIDDLDAPVMSAFLADLETKRGASARTRNLRLTAIRSFLRFVSFEEPARMRPTRCLSRRADRTTRFIQVRSRNRRPPAESHYSSSGTIAGAHPCDRASRNTRPPTDPPRQWAVITHHGPEPAGLRIAFGQHRHRCVVGVQPLSHYYLVGD